MSLRQRLHDNGHINTKWAWSHAGLLLVLAVSLLALYRTFDSPLGTAPLTEVNRIVPAAGVEGFNVEAFVCDDKQAKVKPPETQPDSAILTYTIERVRDNRQELVIWKDSGRGAEHWYFDQAGIQQKEPAVVSEKARDCIVSKAGK